MMITVFTAFRREMLARTFFDLLKISMVAAFASQFFAEFPKVVQYRLRKPKE